MLGRALLCLLLVCGSASAGDSYPWGNITLRTGQIVVADGVGPSSVLLSLVATEYSAFSHSGLLIIEDNGPYVYEAIGKYPFWTTESPGEATRGRISRTPLSEFLNQHAHVEFYDPPAGVDPGAAALFARRAYLDKVPFDAHFAPDPDSYYCSELVARALEAAGGSIRFSKFRDNPSLLVLRRWLGATHSSIITVSSLIEGARYAGTLTVYPSRATFNAYVAAKRELHRRFTPDQKLGNLFQIEDGKLQMRPAVGRFIDLAMDLFPGDDPPPADGMIQREVHELADAYFGPLESRHASR